MRRLSLITLALLGTPAFAGSISAPAPIAGPDSNAATGNPAAIHYNPAAIGASEGVNVLADVQMAFIRVNVTTTRNDGIDPNTGEAYNVAKARVQVPVALIGATWKVIPNRLALGFAVTDAFVGGGDYRAGDPAWEDEQLSEGESWQSHQRYAGVMTKIITIHMIPAASVTIVDGLHVGGSFKYILDTFEAIQASDPLGIEGNGPDGPYSSDTILEGDLSGSHIGWGAGVLFNRIPQAQIGLSITNNGNFSAEGEGTVTAPAMLGGGKPEALLTFDMPLPYIGQIWLNSQVNDKLLVGAGAELQMWGMCCSDHEGDAIIGVTSSDGDPLGADPEDGIIVQVADTQYSARRLRSSANIAAAAGYQLNQKFWLGGRGAFNMNAVPDNVVSATNLDFQSVGMTLAGRWQATNKLQLGLSYSKFFTFEREITNSAWDIRDTSSPDYVDEYLSPATPYKANTNGTYASKVDIVGVRIGAHF